MNKYIKRCFSLFFLSFLFLSSVCWAQNQSLELNGDTIEYSLDGNKVIISGNVMIIYQGTTLACDNVEFYRDTMMAHATGNVRLMSKQGGIRGEKINFDFKNNTGDFNGARINMHPYYGAGEKITKVGDDLMLIENGYLTTSDHDKPGYKITSKRIEVYPGEKIVSRSVKLVLGDVPVFYMPRLTQRLDDQKPKLVFTPGYDKDWGMFLLSQYRYYFNENFKGTLHLDARERKDVAWGVDVDYKSRYGDGSLRTYYMNERDLAGKYFYEERESPTIEKERFKVQWRHKWDIDDKTSAIMQYYRLSDSTILKDYFENEYDEDSNPDTYFLLTRRLPQGIVSFQTDVRVNRFTTKVERLPELRYDLGNVELGESGLYLKNISTYSNLTKKYASPSEVNLNTMRLDTDSVLSYPKKVGIIEFTPYVGLRNTYYSKTKDPSKYGAIRGQFSTGASLSTKFYRVFDFETDMAGVDINRLRHIITPTVSYSFANDPTVDNVDLDQYDAVDALTNQHKINFSLENKLQTKRNGQSVDLVRLAVDTNFYLKEDPSSGSFGIINVDLDVKPAKWLTFYFDAQYDTPKDRLSTANFDMYINGGDKWVLDLGKRWNRDVDDQLTAEFSYRVNPKWYFSVYERYDLDRGIQKEQSYSLTRDLHSWEVDMTFREERGEGSEILLLFRLKAFPDLGIDMGTSFNKRREGSGN